MSLYQCDKCGCLENTACSNFSHSQYLLNKDFEEYSSRTINEREQKALDAMKSYKRVLGLKDEEPFGKYCSACSPLWYQTKEEGGGYGVGPNPRPSKEEGDGIWHDVFDRMFLPKGQFYTDRHGNLAHKKTHKTDVDKYALDKEEGT